MGLFPSCLHTLFTNPDMKFADSRCIKNLGETVQGRERQSFGA